MFRALHGYSPNKECLVAFRNLVVIVKAAQRIPVWQCRRIRATFRRNGTRVAAVAILGKARARARAVVWFWKRAGFLPRLMQGTAPQS